MIVAKWVLYCYFKDVNVNKISGFCFLFRSRGAQKIYALLSQTDSEFPLIRFNNCNATVENLMDQIKQKISFEFDAPNMNAKESSEPGRDVSVNYEPKSDWNNFYHFKESWEINTGHIAFCCATKNTKSFGNDLIGGYFTQWFIEYFIIYQDKPFLSLLQGLKEKLRTTEVVCGDVGDKQKTYPGIKTYYKTF